MLFLDNKYTKCYFSIVNKAKSRVLPPDTYLEKHHILPRSLGGNNSKDNLVSLTGREHFICHILLTKMTTGKEYFSMMHAAIGMKRSRSYQERYINNRIYETLKKEYSAIIGQRNKGKTASPETREKMSIAKKGKKKPEGFGEQISNALKGKSKPPMLDSIKEKISSKLKGRNGHRRGKTGDYKHTDEAKQKIAESNKRRVYSQETKDKIAAGVKAANERRKLAA